MMPLRRPKASRRISVIALAAVATAVAAASGAAHAQRALATGAPRPLFEPIAAPAPAGAAADDPAMVRWQPVLVDRSPLAGVRAGTRFRLDLPGREPLTAVMLNPVAPDGWTGFIEGVPGGACTIVSTGGAVAAHINAPGTGTWQLRPTAGGGHAVVELDPQELPPCGNGPEQDAGPPPEGGIAGLETCADGAEVDVLVLYTTVARQAMGSVAAIEAEIELAVALSNICYDNSVIGTQLNLVHMQETSYNESGTYSQHLDRLATPGDGFMDEAHALRYEHQADLVALIVNDNENCGIAYLLPALSPASAYSGFSVTTWFCAAGGLTLAHELGHNMGCCHAPGDGGGCTRGGFYDYSVGYRYTGDSFTLWRTVMAYQPGQRIQNFSNPDVVVDGQPTGIAVGQPGQADNAITINQTIATVASYRCGLPYCDVVKHEASDGGGFDYFGFSADISGDAALIGAMLHSSVTLFGGAVYAYRYDSGTMLWSEQDKLMAPDSTVNDFFGFAVAVDGDAAIISATGDADLGADSGSAYIFRYNPGTTQWDFEQKLLPDDGEAGDRFGESVDISGDVAVVGAWFDSDNGSEAGSAYIFRYNGDTTTWVQEDKLLASDPTAADHFGSAAAIDGDVVVVGAPSTVAAAQTGAAYVYRYLGGSTWGDEVKLLASDGAIGDRFGDAVALDGDVAVIGAFGDNDTANGAGSAYVFRFDGNAWPQEDKLLAADGTESDRLGASVSVSGGIAVVGADGVDDMGPDAGAAYVYRSTGSSWQQMGKLLALDGDDADAFGVAVAVSGSRAVVGANAAGNGAMYLYSGFTGTDCNGNGADDECEILSGAVEDANGNGVPDGCETVTGDINGDGVVGVLDLLQMLGAWGPCADCGNCPEDLNDDCAVDVVDLLILLSNWTV